MIRVNVTLRSDERDALWLLSEQERRDPRAQAALLIRQSLEQMGLLQPTPAPTGNPSQDEAPHAKT